MSDTIKESSVYSAIPPLQNDRPDSWPEQKPRPKQKIQTPESAAQTMRLHLGYVLDEHIVVILLDAQDHEIVTVTVADGIPDAVMTSVEKIMRQAIMHEARGVIIGHNHPSGNPEPSREDTAFVRKLKGAFAYLDHTRLLDCIIIGDRTNQLFSYGRSTWELQK